MTGYAGRLDGHGACTGRWRWSCWSLLFRWFGVVRLEVEYQITDMPSGVMNWRKATTDEWQMIVASANDPV